MNEKIVEKIINIIEENFEDNSNYFIEGISRIPVSGKVIDSKEIINGVQAVLNANFTSDFLLKASKSQFHNF